MPKITWTIGKRVGLMYYPFCYGKIVGVKKRHIVADIVSDDVYKVQWDTPSYGTSDWLGFNDLLEEEKK